MRVYIELYPLKKKIVAPLRDHHNMMIMVSWALVPLV